MNERKTIYLDDAIDALIRVRKPINNGDGTMTIMTLTDAVIRKVLEGLPSAQPETYKEKLKEIADALSEKFAYMHTCLNERDIILGYLGVKHSNEIHCNTDCTNIKCESYRFNKRLPSAQPVAKDINVLNIEPRKKGKWIDEGQYADFFPHHAYRCSECGHHLLEIEVIYDFCPFCGADMRGEDHESNRC